MKKIFLSLENGDTIVGKGFCPEPVNVELVFTTSWVGYEESLTDPSYNGQGLIFAYPLIGNYGVDSRRFESESVQPDLVIARELTNDVSSWLREANIPVITSVDTRQLVRTIREEGSMVAGSASTQRAAQRLCAKAMNHGVTMTYRSRDDLPKRYGNGNRPIVAMLDCGVKTSMIDHLVERGAHVVRLPWDVNAKHMWSYDPDLLFVSNGPGNPKDYEKAIHTIKQVHGQVPLAGICLGQQLITIALGGGTRKMKFGHRGVNQPVYDKEKEQVVMSTQNHSYCVDDIPESLEIYQYNINDDTVEGLKSENVRAIQWHPEASPGPHDGYDFFDKIIDLSN